MSFLVDPADLYSTETIVFQDQLEKVDMNKPVYVLRDPNGKLALTDGNHRAKRALMNKEKIPAETIGELSEPVENDSDFRKLEAVNIKTRFIH